ncbi:MAG TPA: TadE/TadG family type IV pilus assembly protein [Bryobacteraceae bacterium]|nr:TadE/TadG family type IV pilus assembly protein [Bryobacteraceae bacterium]
MKRERGQGLIEATFVLLAFFVLLLGTIDCAQVLFAHQALVERVRSSVRWGVVHEWQGPERIVNLILYNQIDGPRAAAPGFLGLKPENVRVKYREATSDRPDDETLTVEIVNFECHFFTPVIGKTLVNPRPVKISAPVSFKTR